MFTYTCCTSYEENEANGVITSHNPHHITSQSFDCLFLSVSHRDVTTNTYAMFFITSHQIHQHPLFSSHSTEFNVRRCHCTAFTMTPLLITVRSCVHSF